MELGALRWKCDVHVLGFKFPRGGHNFSRRMVLNKDFFKGGRVCPLNKILGGGDGTFLPRSQILTFLFAKIL